MLKYTQYEAAVAKRRWAGAVLGLIVTPLTLAASLLLGGSGKYMLLSLLILIYSMLPFFMVFEKRRPKAREIVLIAVMTAITVLAHMVLHVTIPIQAGTALVIVCGVAMGPEAGFLVGALARFICNFYLGQGVWTPWQMFCWGLLGFLAGLVFTQMDLQELKGSLKLKTRKAGTEKASQSKFPISEGGIKDSIKTESRRKAASKESIEDHNFKDNDPDEAAESVIGAAIRTIGGPVLCVLTALLAGYITYMLWPGQDESFWGWRIYAFGAVGLIAGALLQRSRLQVTTVNLCAFTFFSVTILYGGLMNLCSAVTIIGTGGSGGSGDAASDAGALAAGSGNSGENLWQALSSIGESGLLRDGGDLAVSLDSIRALLITGLPYDLLHAALATLCIFLFGQALIRKIERVKIKYGIYK